jgi:hypothetical protein
MIKPLQLALLLAAAFAVPAAAQNTAPTSGVAGSGLTTTYGAIKLPATGTASSTAPVGSGSLTTGASAGGGSATGAGRANASATGASSGSTGSGGSSGAGVGTGSSSVPAWLLCPPSGAAGGAPFLTGTTLSCAP